MANLAEQTLTQLSGIASILSTQRVDANLPKYKGDPKKFREWIKSVEKYRKILNGDENSTKIIAYQSCDGPVSDFVQRFLTVHDDCTWVKLKAELTARFADITDPQHAMHLLRRLRQQKDESVQLFAERLLALAEDAWPEHDLTNAEIANQLINIYTDGWIDSRIARKLMRDTPTTLEAAVTIATTEQNLNRRFALRQRNDVGRQTANRAHTGRNEEPMDVSQARANASAVEEEATVLLIAVLSCELYRLRYMSSPDLAHPGPTQPVGSVERKGISKKNVLIERGSLPAGLAENQATTHMTAKVRETSKACLDRSRQTEPAKAQGKITPK